MSCSSLVTRGYLEEEKISWNIAGEDAESLDGIYLRKATILSPESRRGTPLATTSLIFLMAKAARRGKSRYKSHAFAQSATGTLVDVGQRAETEGETLGDCRVGGVTNGGIHAHRVERTVATEQIQLLEPESG